MEGHSAGLEDKIKEWLVTSGAKDELQARLRADLYLMITKSNELGLKDKKSKPASVGPKERAVNWLISQHLTQNKCWLSNSVFVTEAEITGSDNESLVKQKEFSVEVAGPETLDKVLEDLELGHTLNSTAFVKHCSFLSQLLVADHRNHGAVINTAMREKPNKKTLDGIDLKYKEILKQHENRRNNFETNHAYYPPPPIYVLPQLPHMTDNGFNKKDRNKKRREMMKNADHSETSCDMNLYLSDESRADNAMKKPDLEALCTKVDEFLTVHKLDKTNAAVLETKLLEADDKIRSLSLHNDNVNSLKETLNKYQKESTELKSMLKAKDSKIENQQKEICNLKSQLEAYKLVKNSSTNQNNSNIEAVVSCTVKESEGNTTKYFLSNIKSKMEDLGREENEINDEFDNFNFQSSLKE